LQGVEGSRAMLTRQLEILQAPPGLRPKVTAFAIGLAVTIGLYAFIGPRSPAWRSAHTTDLSSPSLAAAGSAPRAAPSEAALAPSGPEARTSDPANAATAPVSDPPLKRAAVHKASRATKRHSAKRRAAAKR
jgi:hypothetical protein